MSNEGHRAAAHATPIALPLALALSPSHGIRDRVVSG